MVKYVSTYKQYYTYICLYITFNDNDTKLLTKNKFMVLLNYNIKQIYKKIG